MLAPETCNCQSNIDLPPYVNLYGSLGKFSRRQINDIFLPENRHWHFMQIVFYHKICFLVDTNISIHVHPGYFLYAF